MMSNAVPTDRSPCVGESADSARESQPAGLQLEALGCAPVGKALADSWRAPTGDVAADEPALHLMGNVHHDEAAGGGIDNEISRLGDGCRSAALIRPAGFACGWIRRSTFSPHLSGMP